MVAVTDPDVLANDIVATVTADDAEAVITVATTTGLVVAGNGTDVLSLTGSQSDINASLASLTVASNNVGDTTVTVAGTIRATPPAILAAHHCHPFWLKPSPCRRSSAIPLLEASSRSTIRLLHVQRRTRPTTRPSNHSW